MINHFDEYGADALEERGMRKVAFAYGIATLFNEGIISETRAKNWIANYTFEPLEAWTECAMKQPLNEVIRNIYHGYEPEE